MKQDVDFYPALKAVIDGCYDPKGGYVEDPKVPGQLVQMPWSKDNQPQGTVSLSAFDYIGFKAAAKQSGVSLKDVIIQDVGGGGAVVPVATFAAIMEKLGPGSQVIVNMNLPDE